MDYIIVGCGRVGAELAYRMFEKGHKVTIIDIDDRAFSNLSPEFRGRLIEGEALNQDVLALAGINSASGLAAVTNSDSLNAVIAHIARTVYGVKNVIVRNYDTRWRPMYEAFDLQVVSSASWGAQRIEELLYDNEMRTVFSAGNGEVEVYEFSIPQTWQGRRMGDLVPAEGCSFTALTRAGRAILPNRDTVLQDGDAVLVSATYDGIEKLRRTLENGAGGAA